MSFTSWVLKKEIRLFLPSAIKASANGLSGFLLAHGISQATTQQFTQSGVDIALQLAPAAIAYAWSVYDKSKALKNERTLMVMRKANLIPQNQ